MAKGTTDKRRLIKFSNYSMCVTLPKWVIDQLEWKKGDVLTLVTDVKQGKITLSKAKEEKGDAAAKAEPVAQPTEPSESSVTSEEIIPIAELPASNESNDTPKLQW